MHVNVLSFFLGLVRSEEATLNKGLSKQLAQTTKIRHQ
jgi:hypothetical protein